MLRRLEAIPHVGLSRADIQFITAVTSGSMSAATVDLVGDIEAPSVVIQPNTTHADGPAYHLEKSPVGFVVCQVQGDLMTEIGTFDELATALCSLGSETEH